MPVMIPFRPQKGYRLGVRGVPICRDCVFGAVKNAGLSVVSCFWTAPALRERTKCQSLVWRILFFVGFCFGVSFFAKKI